MKTRILSLSVIFFFFVSIANLFSTTRTSVQPGFWNDAATWGGTAPVSGDDVIVAHPVDISIATTCASLTVNTGGLVTLYDNLGVTGSVTGAGTLAHSSSQTLSVGGDFTISTYNAMGGTFILNGSGSGQNFNAGAYNSFITSGTAPKIAIGSITVAGLLITNMSSILDMSTFTLTGPFIATNNGTIRFSGATNGRVTNTGTIEYYGGTQTITDGTYATLLLSNAGNKTIDLATSASVVTVSSAASLILNGTLAANVVTVSTTSSIILNNTLSVASSMTVNGDIQFPNNTFIDGIGSFTLASTGMMQVTSPLGITLAGGGNVQSTGTRIFSPTASYVYEATSQQVTGNGFTGASSLFINNTFHIKLSTSATITTDLNFVNGSLFTNGNTISLGNASTNASSTNFIVTSDGMSTLGGSLERTVTTSRVFPIGPRSDKYMPITVTGAGTYNIGMVATRAGLDMPSKALLFSWDFKTGTAGTIDLAFQWPNDLTVQGADFPIGAAGGEVERYSGSWASYPAAIAGGNPNSATASGVPCCSEYTVGGIDALPIVLTNFTAIKDKRNVNLYWSTASEKNNDHFSVERSNDGLSYKEIGNVKGAGNSFEPKGYKFTDDRTALGNNYYRLKQVDFDGAYSYSPVRVVNMDSDSPFTLYPTLVTNTITLHTSATTDYDTGIELISVTTGAVLYKTSLAAGNSSIDLDLTSIAPGSYVARLQQDQQVFNHLFIKQ